jgi:hypothetical protein
VRDEMDLAIKKGLGSYISDRIIIMVDFVLMKSKSLTSTFLEQTPFVTNPRMAMGSIKKLDYCNHVI